MAQLEGNLDELEKLYPTIPAIEVTIPHVHFLLKLHVPKKGIMEQIKRLRFNLRINHSNYRSRINLQKWLSACSHIDG